MKITEEMKTDTKAHVMDERLKQSNTFTLAHFNYSAQQLDMLLLVVEQLQGFMTKDLSLLEIEAQGELTSVVIDMAQLMERQNYEDGFLLAKEFVDNHIDFKLGKIEGRTSLASTVIRVENTSKVRLDIPHVTMSLLCYLGEGAGATFYQKATSLSLKGKYDKRLYTVACSIHGRKDPAYFDLMELRQILGVKPHLYKEAPAFIQKILKPNCESISTSTGFQMEYITVREGRSIKGFKLIATSNVKTKKDENVWQLADGSFVKFTSSEKKVAPTNSVDSMPMVRQLVLENELVYVTTPSHKIAENLSFQSNISSIIHMPKVGVYLCVFRETPNGLTLRKPKKVGSAPMFFPVNDKMKVISRLPPRTKMIDVQATQIEDSLHYFFSKDVVMWGAIGDNCKLAQAKSYYYVTKS